MHGWPTLAAKKPMTWILAVVLALAPVRPASAARPNAHPTPVDSTGSTAAGIGSRSPVLGTVVRLSVNPSPGAFMRAPFIIRQGVLVRATPESLWLAPGRGRAAGPVALANVQRIEVFAGEDRVGGALIGTVAGAALGVMVGLVAGSILLDRRTGEDQFVAVYAAFSGGLLGAPAGAIIGGIRGLDRWERVE